jgi:hypothetical protein
MGNTEKNNFKDVELKELCKFCNNNLKIILER